MKRIENQKLLEFLQLGRNDFGWTVKYLINQIVSTISVVVNGFENPKLAEETRTLLLDMFRESDKSYANMWGPDDIASLISPLLARGTDYEETFRILFELCKATKGNRLGSGASVP